MGQFVRKGQVLALLKSVDFIQKQQSYIEAVNKFSYTEKEYERKGKLLRNDATSAKEFQALELDYKNLKTQMNSLKAELGLYGVNSKEIEEGKINLTFPVVSPIQGYIGSITTNLGAYAESQKELFQVLNTEALQLNLLVYASDLMKVKGGQRVSFMINGKSDQELIAEISSIDKTFEKDANSVHVHASLKGVSKDLTPGMYVNARITVDDYKAEALPEDAVIKEGEKAYIFIQTGEDTDNRGAVSFQKVNVITGVSDNGYIEVKPITQIDDKAEIVTQGAYYINSEMIKDSGGQDND